MDADAERTRTYSQRVPEEVLSLLRADIVRALTLLPPGCSLEGKLWCIPMRVSALETTADARLSSCPPPFPRSLEVPLADLSPLPPAP